MMKNENGSTIIEFLIFTPIMVLLAFYATKISHDEKMKKRNILTGRNMIFQGQNLILNHESPENIINNFQHPEKHLNNYSAIENKIKIGITNPEKLSEREILKTTSSILKSSGEKSNPEYVQYYDRVSSFTSALLKSDVKNNTLKSHPLFSNSMELRKAKLLLSKNDDANGFQKSINHIQDFYSNHDEKVHNRPNLVTNLYYQGDDLYHNQEGTKLTLPSLQLVTGTDKWTSTNNPGQSENYFQNKCQGGFSSSHKSCGDTDFLLLDRPSFAKKIYELAEAKINLFEILSQGEIAPIHAQLVSEWANQDAQFDQDWSVYSTQIHKDLVNTSGFENPETLVNLSHFDENHHQNSSNSNTFKLKFHQDIDDKQIVHEVINNVE